MERRCAAKELDRQEYTNPNKFNEELEQAVADFRHNLKLIAEHHSEIWGAESLTTFEYKEIRKAARKDIITELDLLLSNFQ